MSDSYFSPEQPTYIGAMTSPRAQSPKRTQSPSHLTTNELLTRVLSQMETLTNHLTTKFITRFDYSKENSGISRKGNQVSADQLL